MTNNKIKDYNISETDEIPYNKKGEKLYFEYGNNETDIIYRKIRRKKKRIWEIVKSLNKKLMLGKKKKMKVLLLDRHKNPNSKFINLKIILIIY